MTDTDLSIRDHLAEQQDAGGPFYGVIDGNRWCRFCSSPQPDATFVFEGNAMVCAECHEERERRIEGHRLRIERELAERSVSQSAERELWEFEGVGSSPTVPN